VEEVGVPMEVIDVDESDDEIEIVPAVSNPYFRIWSVFFNKPASVAGGGRRRQKRRWRRRWTSSSQRKAVLLWSHGR
jgi:hypothetical protein